MKKEQNSPVRINSIPELHCLLGLPKPLHPLVSLIDNTRMEVDKGLLPKTFLFDFYKISYKKTLKGKIGYGQGYYDFDDGGMVFTAPNQLISVEEDTEHYGSSLVFHPDFIRNYPLGQRMKHFGFFSYETNEALHLSDKEKTIVLNIVESINTEMNATIDDFSQDVILSYMELLLNYSNRFYKRQFITRKAVNRDVLTQMEQLITGYFETDASLHQGLPTVEYIAEQLHLSPRYLSDMLRTLTGYGTQQHIHEKLIEKAKEYLSTTTQSVAEIAYQLGFERPQSFNKLFRKKTNTSPLAFRQSFN